MHLTQKRKIHLHYVKTEKITELILHYTSFFIILEFCVKRNQVHLAKTG